MRVLVIGGAGYIGSVLAKYLLKKGYFVAVFDNLQFGGESILDLFQNERFRFIHGDIRNKAQVIKALKGIDSVVHLAAVVGDPAGKINPQATEEINYKGSKNVCDSAKNLGIKRFIQISTCSNYGISDENHPATEESPLHPISLYATTKIAAEKYVIKQTDNNFCVCILRLATAYGISYRMRFDLLINEIVRDGFLNKKVIVYQPLAWRPFVHVYDICRAIETTLNASANKIAGEIFNVGSKNYQKQEIVDHIKKYIPDCREEIVNTMADQRNYSVNFGKIKKVLGFKAQISLDDGIKEMLNFLEIGIFKNPMDYRYTNVG